MNRWIKDTYIKYRRIIRFGLVGISGIPVNYVFIYIGKASLFTKLPVRIADALAYLLGIVVSIFTNFVLNYLWTWGDRRKAGVQGFFEQMSKFYVVSALGAGIQYGVSLGVSNWLMQYPVMKTHLLQNYQLYNLIAPAVGILVAFVVNFWVNNRWTFRPESNPSEKQKQGQELQQ